MASISFFHDKQCRRSWETDFGQALVTLLRANFNPLELIREYIIRRPKTASHKRFFIRETYSSLMEGIKLEVFPVLCWNFWNCLITISARVCFRRTSPSLFANSGVVWATCYDTEDSLRQVLPKDMKNNQKIRK